MWFELDPGDMLTVISEDGPHYLDVLTGEKAKGTPYEAQPFGEASSMRKFNGKYYFIYSSLNSHNLCWAVSDKRTGGFEFGGVLVSCGDIGLPGVPDPSHARMCTGNTHGSVIEINGRHYVFYRRHSNRKQSSCQACAEEIRFQGGRFCQAEMTSCGLNGGPLAGTGHYPAYIACNVYGRNGARFLSMLKHRKGADPFLTQKGGDREGGPTSTCPTSAPAVPWASSISTCGSPGRSPSTSRGMETAAPSPSGQRNTAGSSAASRWRCAPRKRVLPADCRKIWAKKRPCISTWRAGAAPLILFRLTCGEHRS